VENLRTFAKLYGYVRFFHPSEEADAVDWDRLAIYGAGRVKKASSREELLGILRELFRPIAPTARIHATGSEPPPVRLMPRDTTGLTPVAWQHLGVGLGGTGSIYSSKRLNRTAEVVVSAAGVFTQAVEAAPYRGMPVRLRAFVRVDVPADGGQSQLWLRVDRSGGQRGFFDNMGDRPITSNQWTAYEIDGTVADDAERIAFGGFLAGPGRMFVDDVDLLTRDAAGEWQSIDIGNPGFEDGDEGESPPEWITPRPGYRYEVTSSDRYRGDRALLIERTPTIPSLPLFDAHPQFGEAIARELGSGLSGRIPLVLLGDGATTWAPATEYSFETLRAGLSTIDLEELDAADEDLRLGDVVIAWNVFQHFYPYFDVVDVDWDAELTRSLEDALDDVDGADFFRTLNKLVANLEDGHGSVFHPDYTQRGSLPLLLAWVEDQIVVAAIRPRVETIQRGDVIVEVDGVDARRALVESEEYISGSPQWKRFKALRAFGSGEFGASVALTLRQGAEEVQVEIERGLDPLQSEFARDHIEALDNGVFYVDLSRARMAEIRARIDELASARGVIFDLRGYPNANHEVISHLLESPDTSGAWMRVPQVIYPDRENIAGYQNHGWNLPAREPRITGKVVFITDGRAISYAESFMSFIEGYGLAEIVGQPTAGTNGNVNLLGLPGGFRVTWTGMRVVKHDGSQHHLIGIQPTVPVQRTLQGVIEGRDELLEKALEVIGDPD
jgi:hypothetical protein